MAEKFEIIRDAIEAVLNEVASIGDNPDRPTVARFAATRVLEDMAAAEIPKAPEGSAAADLLDALAVAIENVAGMMLPPVACQSLAVVALKVVSDGAFLIEDKKIKRIQETDFQDSTDDGEAWIVYTKKEPDEHA